MTLQQGVCLIIYFSTFALMNPWKWLKDYFNLSSSERRGIAALVVIILLLIIAPIFIPYFFPDKKENFDNIEKLSSALLKDTSSLSKSTPYQPDSSKKKNRIVEDVMSGKHEDIEINSADSATFSRLPRIRPFIAGRIIKFRKLLGGFYTKEQLKEVYGLDEDVYSGFEYCLKVNPALIHKIRINSCSLDELKHHPYIKYKLAKEILKYRDKDAQFASPESFKRFLDLDDETISKISPYISFELGPPGG